MKSVSRAYINSMNSPLRGDSKAEISFWNVNSDCIGNGTWTGYTESYSVLTNIDNTHTVNVKTTLTLNEFLLDGSSNINSNNTDFISMQADSNGDDSYCPTSSSGFKSSDYDGIYKVFDKPEVLSGITINFIGEYPLELVICVEHNFQQTYDYLTFTPDSNEYFASIRATDVTAIGIYSPKRFNGGRYGISYVMYGYGKSFSGEDIASISQKHDIDPLTRRLPNEELKFNIIDFEHRYDPSNPEGDYYYLHIGSRVDVKYGVKVNDNYEWINHDSYVLYEMPTYKTNVASFKAVGVINYLTDTYYKGWNGLTTGNLKSLAEKVLEDADLPTQLDGSNSWDLSEMPNTIVDYTIAKLPICTHAEALQYIASAAGCRLFTDDTNVIHISPIVFDTEGYNKGQLSDNGHLSISTLNNLELNVYHTDSYATLELNRWALDGNPVQVFWDGSSKANGFVSNVAANSEGEYTTNPMITKVFDYVQDITVVNITFDEVMNNFPFDISIKLYDDEDTLLHTENATITTANTKIVMDVVSDVKKLTVECTNMLPGQYFRVNQLLYRQNDFLMDNSTIKKDSLVGSKIDLLKDVQIKEYVGTTVGDSTELFRTITSETNVHAEFNNPVTNVSVSVTGGSVVSQNVYDNAIDLVLSSGAKTVVVTGKNIEKKTNNKSYVYGLLGETSVVDNPLITSSNSQAIADYIANYLAYRDTYKLNYRGNPELETGDIIGLQTNFTNQMDAYVLADELTYNGAFSGSVTLKGLVK